MKCQKETLLIRDLTRTYSFSWITYLQRSSDLILNNDEMDVIVGGEFRQNLNKVMQYQKSAEVLEDERFLESRHTYLLCLMIMWLIIYKYKINFI